MGGWVGGSTDLLFVLLGFFRVLEEEGVELAGHADWEGVGGWVSRKGGGGWVGRRRRRRRRRRWVGGMRCTGGRGCGIDGPCRLEWVGG